MPGRLLVLVLVLSALLPCGVPWDGCQEDGGATCGSLCHLGCATAPVQASTMALPPALLPSEARAPFASQPPIERASLPELPPPRS